RSRPAVDQVEVVCPVADCTSDPLVVVAVRAVDAEHAMRNSPAADRQRQNNLACTLELAREARTEHRDVVPTADRRLDLVVRGRANPSLTECVGEAVEDAHLSARRSPWTRLQDRRSRTARPPVSD